MYLHQYAAIGLTRLATSEEERFEFQQTSLLRPAVASELHQNLVQHALNYLQLVKAIYSCQLVINPLTL